MAGGTAMGGPAVTGYGVNVVTEHGDPPVADAEDLHERYLLTLSSRMVEDRAELSDEHVCVRGVMQHEPGQLGGLAPDEPVQSGRCSQAGAVRTA